MISCTAKFHRLTFYYNSTKQSSIQRGRYFDLEKDESIGTISPL